MLCATVFQVPVGALRVNPPKIPGQPPEPDHPLCELRLWCRARPAVRTHPASPVAAVPGGYCTPTALDRLLQHAGLEDVFAVWVGEDGGCGQLDVGPPSPPSPSNVEVPTHPSLIPCST